MKKLYGWYSEQAAALYGTILYEKSDGSTVNVTAVSKTEGFPLYDWPDKICVGEVTKFIARSSK